MTAIQPKTPIDEEVHDTVVLMDDAEKKLYKRKLSTLSVQQRRAGVAGFVSSILIEPKYPGFVLAFESIKPLIVQLTSLSFRRAFKAYKFYVRMQRLAAWPYPLGVVGGVCFSSKKPVCRKKLDECNRYLKFAISAYTPKEMKDFGLNLSPAELRITSMDYLAKKWCGDGSAADGEDKYLKFLIIQEEALKERPAYFLCADERFKELVLSIRGSRSVNDWITNCICRPEGGSLGHPGMERAAERVDHEVRSTVVTFLTARPDYRIVLTGHSLGAGVASLLAARWLQRIPNSLHERVHVFSFASPCVVPEEQIESYKGRITSIVYGRDIVPRLSYETAERLLFVLQAIINSWRANHFVKPPGKHRRFSTPAAMKPPLSENLVKKTPIRSPVLKAETPELSYPRSPRSTSASDFSVPRPLEGSAGPMSEASTAPSAIYEDDDAASDDEFVSESPLAASLKTFARSTTLLDLTRAGDFVWSDDRKKKELQGVALTISTTFCDLPMNFNELYRLVKRRAEERVEEKRAKGPSLASRLFGGLVRCGTTSEREDVEEDTILKLTARAIRKVEEAHRSSTRSLVPLGTAIFVVPKKDFELTGLPSESTVLTYCEEVQEGGEAYGIKKRAMSKQAKYAKAAGRPVAPPPTFFEGDCAFYVHPGQQLSYIAENPCWDFRAFSEHSSRNYLKAFCPELFSC